MQEEGRGLKYSIFIGFIVLTIIMLLVGWYVSQEPDTFDVEELVAERKGVTGYATTEVVITISETLLDKPGGFMSNDKPPPFVFLDNIPAWEVGALIQVRDMTRALRKSISRSQSQSIEDKDLKIAEPKMHIDTQEWMFPSAEDEYRKGITALRSYQERLADPDQSDAQFYARADNLRDWLSEVENRLGALSQRLAASVGQKRVNTNLAGDSAAKGSTHEPSQVRVQTPWSQIDDVFYEARGSCWAILHMLEAIEIDFRSVLLKKNAVASMQQIIRELEATQQTLWSPLILNGDGFGMLANHSLVMASYISRANAAIIDLRELLSDG
jgi:hypothetical protein